MHKLKSDERTALLNEHIHLPLAEPKDVQTPMNGGKSIPHLTIHHNGLQCHGCEYLSTNQKSMKVHCNKEHKFFVTKNHPVYWNTIKLQTFFHTSGYTKYFIVDDQDNETEGNLQGEIFNEITKHWREQEIMQATEQNVLTDGTHKQDTNAWFQYTGWAEYFKNKNIIHISHMSRIPDREEVKLKLASKLMDDMFDQCIDILKTLPKELCRWLRSTKKADPDMRPLAPLQDKTSQNRYVAYWKRFIYYCLRLVDEGDKEIVLHGIHFDALQKNQLELISELLQNSHTNTDKLVQNFLAMSASFLMQKLEGKIFHNPIIHFMAVMGIDERRGQFRQALHYTYILAGLLYCSRIIIIGWTIHLEKQEQVFEPIKRLRKMHQKWLVDGSDTPVSTIISTLAYGKKIARETGSRATVHWSENSQILYFCGKPITMDDFRGFLRNLIDDAENLLWDELFFATTDSRRFTIDLSKVQDNMTSTKVGESFISFQENEFRHGEQTVLRNLLASRKRRIMLDIGKWKLTGRKYYNSRVQQFLEWLLILMHITGGQPARGTEITALRHSNSITQDRNIFIIDGKVTFITLYHKSQVIFRSSKVIPRFLPDKVGQLLAIYLIYIRPFFDQINISTGGLLKSNYIWFDGKAPWNTEMMSKILARETEARIGISVTIQDYRHMAIAISRQHVQKWEIQNENEEDDDSDGFDTLEDLQAAHRSVTARNYGVSSNILKSLDSNSINLFRIISKEWHRFLNLEISNKGALRKRTIAEVDGVGKNSPKRQELVIKNSRCGCQCPHQYVPPPFTQYSSDQVQEALNKVLDNKSSTFSSAKQEEAVLATIRGESPLVVILPTGGGKSITFMLPAILSQSGITIVVAPFTALVENLVKRCKAVGIDCIHWMPGQINSATIVVVGAERAIGDEFMTYASRFATKNHLRRIVVDECHLIITASDYRKRLSQLRRLRVLSCPILLLTATLPPIMQDELEHAMLIPNPRYIRMQTYRQNIQYAVQKVATGKAITTILGIVSTKLQKFKEHEHEHERGIIYCTKKNKCEILAGLLKCNYYHSNSEEKHPHLNNWLNGEKKFIVATGSLGTGIDFPGITCIIHMNWPYGMIDFVQESGRGGRGGEKVESIVVIEEMEVRERLSRENESASLNEQELSRFINTTGCRRTPMSQFLDERSVDCSAIDAERCDNCASAAQCWRSEAPLTGLQLFKEEGRHNATGLHQMEQVLNEIRDETHSYCPPCWVLDGLEDADHIFFQCQQRKDLVFSK
ncbi:ATP-dependent DNA helicase tlh1, partial [Neolecta irregularis DAH-3]